MPTKIMKIRQLSTSPIRNVNWLATTANNTIERKIVKNAEIKITTT
ncbi:hypothetical protein LSA01_09920 [Latilactobacillus sakei]|nr:secreted protein containing DUF58 [Latilactobacillus sakei subsp. sakei DSM 20017 = JCM 1157]GEA76913.1 hypothetical protein LSA01_09920 [Latilactobacillus sakei]